MAQKTLAVLGGNGFLGTRICKAAVQKNWNVISLARSGEPNWKGVGNESRPDWADNVTWVKADIFQPATYESHLRSTDAVVHSMGLLLEADYKDVLRGKESPISGLRKAFQTKNSARLKSTNPLDKVAKNASIDKSGGEQDLTYESMNRDSALIAANAFEKSSSRPNRTFLYISAAAGFPILPERYILTKREAEDALSKMTDTRSILFRPGFLYSKGRPITIPLSYLVGVSSAFNKVTNQLFSGILGAAGSKPLDVEMVGQAAMEAIQERAVHGVVESPMIETLGNK